jgi:protein-S-isoprenylcysteine O-methyltransferase Ste14
MQTTNTIIGLAWLIWLGYWLVSAFGVKPNVRRAGWRIGIGFRLVIGLAVLAAWHWGGIGTPGAQPFWAHVAGLVLVLAGLGLAVWARIYLGRNWGVSMAQKQNPELVTSGPYRWIRHPIYSGVILAIIGTAMSMGWAVLVPGSVAAGYFVYAARREERNLETELGEPYRSYRARSKMLVPFVF